MFEIEITRQGAESTQSIKSEIRTLETAFLPINQLFLGQKYISTKNFLVALGNAVTLAFCLTGSNWSNDKEHKGRKMTTCLMATTLGFNVTDDQEKNAEILEAVDTFIESILPESDGDNTDIISVTYTPSNKPVEHVYL